MATPFPQTPVFPSLARVVIDGRVRDICTSFESVSLPYLLNPSFLVRLLGQ